MSDTAGAALKSARTLRAKSQLGHCPGSKPDLQKVDGSPRRSTPFELVRQRADQLVHFARRTGVGPARRLGEHDKALEFRLHDACRREPRVDPAGGDRSDRIARASGRSLVLQLHRVGLDRDLQPQAVLDREVVQPRTQQVRSSGHDEWQTGKLGHRQLVARDELPVAELSGLPLVVPARPHLLRARLDHLAIEHGLRLQVAIEADSVQLQYEAAAAGAGYAIASIAAGRIDARLASARIVQPELERFVVLAESPRRPHTRATREVHQLVCTLADQLERG